jgi:hypothetical protein
MQAYNEAIATAKRPESGKFADLIALYKKSAEFTTRSAKTQKDYRRYIKLIEEKFGTMSISALGAPAVRGVLKAAPSSRNGNLWRKRQRQRPRRPRHHAGAGQNMHEAQAVIL